MTMLERVAKLRELEKEVIADEKKDLDWIVSVRYLAPDMLAVLSGFREGDADLIACALESTHDTGTPLRNVMKRMLEMARKMEEKE